MIKEKDNFYVSLVLVIFFALFSILLLFFPSSIINIIYYGLGIIIGILGIIGIINFFRKKDNERVAKFGIVYGIVLLIIAIILIIKKDELSKLLPIIIGLFIIISSAFDMKYMYTLKKQENSNYIVLITILIISIILGIILLINPFNKILLFTEVISIILFMYAILKLLLLIVTKINIKEQ